MSVTRKMDGARSWAYLATASLTLVLEVGSTMTSFGIYVVVFAEHFNETNSKIAWIGATANCMQCIIYPFAVYFRRRFGARAVIFIGALLFTSAHVTTPLVPSVNYLFLTYSVPVGSCIGLIDCVTVVTLCEYFDKYLNLVTGMRFAAVMTGAMTFNYILPILIDDMGWKKTFFCLSSFGAFILFYAFTYQRVPIEEEKRTTVLMTEQGEEKISGKQKKPRGFLRNKEFWLLCAGCFFQSFTFLVPTMFMAAYAKTLGYPLSKSKWLLLGHSCGSLIGRLTGGVLSDILSKKMNIFYSLGAVFLLYGFSSAVFTLTTNIWLLMVYMWIIGYLDGLFYVMVVVMIDDVTAGSNMEYTYSVMVLFMGVGYMSGPPAMGWIYDVTGDFPLVLYVVSACLIFASGLMIFGTWVKSKCDGEMSGIEEPVDCVKTLDEKYLLVEEKETVI